MVAAIKELKLRGVPAKNISNWVTTAANIKI